MRKPSILAAGLMLAACSDDASSPTASDAPGVEARSFIAFTSDRAGNFDVYAVRPDGTELNRLTTGLASDRNPRWLPDGSGISFLSGADGVVQLLAARPPGSIPTALFDVDWLTYIHDWAPVGNRLAMSSTEQIYTIGDDGGNPVVVANPNRGGCCPAWSPDGRQITFVSWSDGNPEIYVMDPDGGNPRNLSLHREYDDSPAWSPDGRWIAFSSKRHGSPGDVYVMQPDGTQIRRVTFGGGGSPTWSPDGAQIAFVSDRDGNREIYVIDVDGGSETNITNDPGGDYAPAWSGFREDLVHP